ncbi:hypothetical protein [Nocardia pseudovaccinii]|uniref:hypothetical protein n=1 Tax=Nocardia pseudovaccinii TaxID=189540 RepID=UPI0007A38700|nr:hypothetical protein [Nocardia pseudovaccinii]
MTTSAPKSLIGQRFIVIRHDDNGAEYAETVTLIDPDPRAGAAVPTTRPDTGRWLEVRNVTTDEVHGHLLVFDDDSCQLRNPQWTLSTRHPSLRAAFDALSSRLDGH